MSKALRLTSIAFVAALVCVVQSAQAQGDPKRAPKALPPELLARILAANAIKQLLPNTWLTKQDAFGTKNCESADCEIKIVMRKVTATVTIESVSKTIDLCIAALPETAEFKNTAAGNPPKKIAWVIDTSGFTGGPVEFLAENGVVVISDAHSQLKPDKKRTTNIRYEGQNVHRVKGSMAYYIPLIYETVSGTPQLCATADPKIVNN